jgi:hypothetical protein
MNTFQKVCEMKKQQWLSRNKKAEDLLLCGEYKAKFIQKKRSIVGFWQAFIGYLRDRF